MFILFVLLIHDKITLLKLKLGAKNTFDSQVYMAFDTYIKILQAAFNFISISKKTT